MKKIRSISQTIRVLLVIAILFQCLSWGYFSIFTPDSAALETSSDSYKLYLESNFEGMEVVAQQLIASQMNAQIWLKTPGTLFHLVLYFLLFKLFTQFYHGDIFSLSVSQKIRQLGIWMLVWPITLIIYPPLLVIALKITGILEHGELEIALGSDHLSMIIVGAMISVIGWIMEEASRLKQEQELTI